MAMKKLTLLLMLCFSINAAAQTTSEIFGSVVTLEDQALPGVSITAESSEITENWSAISSENGNFIFRMLPPGEYLLTAQMPGMREEKLNIEVTLLEPARARFVMVPEEAVDE